MCSGSMVTSTPATLLLKNICKIDRFLATKFDFDFSRFLHDLMDFSTVVKYFLFKR